jgi:hypothetical protein
MELSVERFRDPDRSWNSLLLVELGSGHVMTIDGYRGKVVDTARANRPTFVQ